MNLKVPGAILPLGCAILSTRAKTVRGVVATPLRRTTVKALNLADKVGLVKRPVTTELLGRKWPEFKKAEMTRRKEHLEAEKAKKASQKKGGGAKGGSNQSFQAPQKTNSSKSSSSQKPGASQRGGQGGGSNKGGSGGKKDGAGRKDGGGGSETSAGASKGNSSGGSENSGQEGGQRGGGRGGRGGGRFFFPQWEGDCPSSERLVDVRLPTSGSWTLPHQATSWSSHAPASSRVF